MSRPTDPITVMVPMVFKWKPYKPNSDQYRKGMLGRWQEANEYGGFTNTQWDVDALRANLFESEVVRNE